MLFEEMPGDDGIKQFSSSYIEPAWRTEANMANVNEADTDVVVQDKLTDVDSKYRLIIVAAKRSKQLQRGARPRIDIDPQKHKPTRIALEEVLHGKVDYSIVDGERKKS
jgi:DNA-directed RNA polymerase subunit omega